MLAVDLVTTEGKDGQKAIRYDKVVVRCLSCGDTHDSNHVNVPNFANIHFLEPKREAICKKTNATGLFFSRHALLPKIHRWFQEHHELAHLHKSHNSNRHRKFAASLAETRDPFAAAKVQQSLSFGQTQQSDQSTLQRFVVDNTRLREAQQELAMHFYTSSTLPERVRKPHLKRSFALLGADVLEPRDLRGSYLDAAAGDTKKSVLEAVSSKRYAIVTDGWSKRTAVCGASLINVNIYPEDAPTIFWRFEDASGRIKDNAYVVRLHQQLRVEMQQAIPRAQFIGYVMDSTSTNVAAMRILREEDPDMVLSCASHALSNLIKHTAKYLSWLDSTYESCCTISEKLINSQKLRAALHEIQEAEHGSVRGNCAHVPTRFGSRHMVVREVLRSEAALCKLAASAEWRAALADSAALKRAHLHITAAENDLCDTCAKQKSCLAQ
jgi:hypothetical protein